MKRGKVDLTVHAGGRMKRHGRWDEGYKDELGLGAGEISGTWLMPFLLISVRKALPCGRELQEQMEDLGFHRVSREKMCRALQKMEREELVSAVGEKSGLLEQRYRITDLGEAYLEFWANSLEDYKKEMSVFFEVYTSDIGIEYTNGPTVTSSNGDSQHGNPYGSPAKPSSIFERSAAKNGGKRSLKEKGSPGVVFVMTGNGLRHMGGALDGFLEHPPEWILWRDVLELVHPNEVDDFRALLDEVMQWPGTSRCVELHVRDVHGRWRPVETTLQNVLEAPIKTDGGLLVANMRDLSR